MNNNLEKIFELKSNEEKLSYLKHILQTNYNILGDYTFTNKSNYIAVNDKLLLVILKMINYYSKCENKSYNYGHFNFIWNNEYLIPFGLTKNNLYEIKNFNIKDSNNESIIPSKYFYLMNKLLWNTRTNFYTVIISLKSNSKKSNIFYDDKIFLTNNGTISIYNNIKLTTNFPNCLINLSKNYKKMEYTGESSYKSNDDNKIYSCGGIVNEKLGLSVCTFSLENIFRKTYCLINKSNPFLALMVSPVNNTSLNTVIFNYIINEESSFNKNVIYIKELNLGIVVKQEENHVKINIKDCYLFLTEINYISIENKTIKENCIIFNFEKSFTDKSYNSSIIVLVLKNELDTKNFPIKLTIDNYVFEEYESGIISLNNELNFYSYKLFNLTEITYFLKNLVYEKNSLTINIENEFNSKLKIENFELIFAEQLIKNLLWKKQRTFYIFDIKKPHKIFYFFDQISFEKFNIFLGTTQIFESFSHSENMVYYKSDENFLQVTYNNSNNPLFNISFKKTAVDHACLLIGYSDKKNTFLNISTNSLSNSEIMICEKNIFIDGNETIDLIISNNEIHKTFRQNFLYILIICIIITCLLIAKVFLIKSKSKHHSNF